MLTKADIINQYNNGKQFSFIGFWGNQSDNEIERSFSNFYKVQFTAPLLHGKNKGDLYTFCCSEQYFMYLKALVFKSLVVAEKILVNNQNPKYYKDLGRKVGNLEIDPNCDPYDDKKWDSLRDKCMLKALHYKFQNKKMRENLLMTDKAVLVETSPYDAIWGIKLGKVDRNGNPTQWRNPNNWKGDNKLGFALMETRDNLLGN